jgi:hypothetical protein
MIPSACWGIVFCNMCVCVCVCVGFVMCGCVCMCGCFDNTCTCIYCVLCCIYCVFVLFRLCIFILILFCLYWCEDCCHRVTTQLQLVATITITITIIIIKYTQNDINHNLQRLLSRSTALNKIIRNRGGQIPSTTCPGPLNLVRWRLILWVLSLGLASRHHYKAWNYNVSPTRLKHWRSP